MFSRRAASEFPNDNPELHDGLVWTSESVCGAALPTLRLRPVEGKLPRVLGPTWAERSRPAEPAAPPTRASVEEAPPVAAVSVEEAPPPVPVSAEEALPPAAPLSSAPACDESSPYDSLVQALVRVALDRGATRVAASLPEWLLRGRPPGDSAERARALLATAPAWRGALDGTAPDLAACGEAPLDVWAADLLSELLAAPTDREVLRRALRRHGVAAFGMRQSSAA